MLAKRRREELLSELARLDAFLELAAELARSGSDSLTAQNTPRARSTAAARGVGADTVAASLEIVRVQGSQATRDLLPMIKARGIPVGGKSEIATLSARLSSTGKNVIEMHEGKWREVPQHTTSEPVTALESEESADQSLAGESADSLFHHTREGRYAPALA